MRKIALLMALVMLMATSLTAAAEPAPALESSYIPFEHPRFGYTIEYPSRWTLLDKDGMDAVFEAIAAGETELSEAGIQMLENARQQIEQSDIAMMLSHYENGHNVNIVASPMDPIPTVEQALEQLAPLLKQQYEQMFPNLNMVDSGSLSQVGGIDSLQVVYEFGGGDVPYTQTQYYTFVQGMQYVITFTWIGPTDEELAQLEAHREHMLESFVPAP